MKRFIKLSLAIAFLAVFASNSTAESRTLTLQDKQSPSASARLKLRVIIPEVLYFQLTGTPADGIPLAVSTGEPAARVNSKQLILTTRSESADAIIYTTTSL